MEEVTKNEAEAESRRVRILPWFAGLLVVAAVYVLSIGPLIRLNKSYGPPSPLLVAYVEPLRILTQHNETFQRFMMWYVGLWNPDEVGARERAKVVNPKPQ